MIDVIFEVPELWVDCDEEGALLEPINHIHWCKHPSDQMPSTRTFGGNKLVHSLIESEEHIQCVLDCSGGKVLAAQGAIIPAVWDYSPLDGYEPIYIETFPIDPMTELPVTEPVMELSEPAPEPILVSAATREIIVPMAKTALLKYMPDQVDEDDVVTRPTKLSLHQFSGRPWSI